MYMTNSGLWVFLGLAGLRELIWDIWGKRRTKFIFDRTKQDLMELQELEDDL